MSLLYECLPYQLFLIPNTVCSSLYIIMMIKQYCFIKLFFNWFVFYFLYCSSVISVVFVLFDVLSGIRVSSYKSCMFCLMYVCDLLHVQLSWDKCWICEIYTYVIQCVPLTTEPGISLIILHVTTIRRTTDTFLFISHTTNVLLFKFRCNIFIGVRIIKEMPGSVVSGTPCIM